MCRAGSQWYMCSWYMSQWYNVQPGSQGRDNNYSSYRHIVTVAGPCALLLKMFS